LIPFLAEKNEKEKRRRISEVSDHLVFIFRVLLAETPKTLNASRLTGNFFLKWLLCVTVGTFFLSRRTAVAWKFGRFSVTEVPVRTFLTGQKTKKQKKYSKKRNFLFLFN
jgi:hypothetical protein